MDENTHHNWATVEEVATHVRLAPFTVRKLFRKGLLPGEKIPGGAQWRARLSEIDAAILKTRVFPRPSRRKSSIIRPATSGQREPQ